VEVFFLPLGNPRQEMPKLRVLLPVLLQTQLKALLQTQLKAHGAFRVDGQSHDTLQEQVLHPVFCKDPCSP
jgi:hypothetical protein